VAGGRNRCGPVANGLAELGVRPRERVAVLMDSRLETVLTLFGILRSRRGRGAAQRAQSMTRRSRPCAPMPGCVAVFASGYHCARIDALRSRGALSARHFIGCDSPGQGWRDFQAFIAGQTRDRSGGGDCTGR
jgi:non-ribosomal peptide synthetase component F